MKECCVLMLCSASTVVVVIADNADVVFYVCTIFEFSFYIRVLPFLTVNWI